MVGILIVTHNLIGKEMLTCAETIIGKSMHGVISIAIPADITPDELGRYADQIKRAIDELQQGDGVLILTDMAGATPSNLVQYFAAKQHVQIITGLNLSMLIRIINYADQPLELLAKIGIVGANKGITPEIDI
jgi:PTS system ascorbate-specific IIA component